ncbi:GntR family transcriptional regulator [Paenibacillus yanchengensis]|uniref:GntR family transcriptional regulator n=1 Tax=Paenibacillus yanchengensis TaxID=2035833 RepID=A0ABW4YGP6_9BACL
MTKHIPMYKEIEKYIIDQIRSNKWPPLSRIPSENELAEQFQVSRITIKNALTALVEQRIVFRQQGKGTFVASDYHQALQRLTKTVSLSEKQDRTVAFLIPRLDNRFTARILSGIEDELAKNNCKLLFAKTNDSQPLEILKIKEMMEYPIDGLIIYPVEGETYNNELLSLTLSKFPLVLVDRLLKGIETNSVSSDHYAASIAAVQHLYQLGHTNIGFVSSKPEGTSSIEERIAGFEMGLEQHHILIDRSLQLTTLNYRLPMEENVVHLRQFLTDHPQLTAIIVSGFGPHATKTAIDMGLELPRELSIIYFDDIEYPELSLISPTVIAQPAQEIGREAVRLLLAQMDGNIAKAQQVRLPTELIVRHSTAPL